MVLDLVLIGLAIAFDPLPLTAFILVLPSQRGVVKGRHSCSGLEEARLTFGKMFTYANHLGLYSEEIGSTGEQLGNFPQAFSHLSLISAAVNLDYQLAHGAGSVGQARSPG